MKRVEAAQTKGLLTELEAKIMTWLLETGYYAEYTFSDVTVPEVAEGIEIDVRSVRGAISSLIKKGYLWVSEREFDIPPLVYATDKGYQLDDDCEERWPEALEGGVK
jgi:DNA-binding MarR family transcriptional regulator